jgi:hypothetical protein
VRGEGYFDWPCDRREAHGPHGDCPGVNAHPFTQIGKGVLPLAQPPGHFEPQEVRAELGLEACCQWHLPDGCWYDQCCDACPSVRRSDAAATD